MNNLDLVTSQYQPGAKTEFENNVILKWYPERILRRLEDVPASSLLELGLGHGYATPRLHQRFERHVVIEGSRTVIDLFKSSSELNNIEVVESFFEDYESDSMFDVILMGFVLEHVDDPLRILSRYKNFLVPGGRVYIAVPNAKSLNRRLGLELGKIRDIYELNDNDLALGHKRQFCLASLRKLAKDAGYSIALEEGIYLKPLPLGYMQDMPEFEDNIRAMLAVGVDFPDLCVGIMMELRVAA